jgi:hypothetical protein
MAVTVLTRPGARTAEADRVARLLKTHVRGADGVWFRPERARLLLRNKRETTWHRTALAFLRDKVHPGIPRAYYRAVLGHDLHVSTHAELYAVHHHATERDPETGRWGWTEDVGRVSAGKVTTAFRDFEIDNLVSDATSYGDYKYHEVGTSAQAEANTDTALITTTGIARATGTQIEASAAVYRSVAPVVADSTETWQEHGLFNNTTGATLMDRSLISPTVAVVSLDTVTFTYEVTKTAEA